MRLGKFELFQKGSAWLTLLSMSVSSFSFSFTAAAAVSQPVTWADQSAIDLRPAFSTQYASTDNLYQPTIPESALLLVLRDADSRVSEKFSIPQSLKPAVGFWLRIYAEYTTQHVVIYDSHHPELVYEVLDFRSLANTARNKIVYEIVSKKRVKTAMAAYRTGLAHLAKNPKPSKPTREEKNILAAIKKLPHKHKYAELQKNVRAQTGQRDNIIKGLLAAETFFPKMEQLFTKMNVPLELTRLTLVESSFNLSATSKVGAAGVWQFMPRSGKEYLTIDNHNAIDERLSPLKATVAAAKLLKRNRKILGNWALAVTSFNHGIRGLPRLNEDEADFVHFAHLFNACSKQKKGKHLGYASANYYAEFLAVLHAEAYRHLFYGDAPKAFPQAVAFRKAEAGKSALQFAMEHGIPLQTFQLYNPDIRNLHSRLPHGFLIAVPGESDDLAHLTETGPRGIAGTKKI
ncbi:lytic transglycosylase domain-containing protein [Bdellovibrionota bacterium FG-1]